MDQVGFLRVRDFNLVPRQLIEQARDLEDGFNYDFLCSARHIAENDNTRLYLIMVEDVIAGVVWGNINPVTKTLFIVLLSVKPEYQGKKHGLVKKAWDFMKTKMVENGCDRFLFVTTRPKAMERYGFKVSKRVLMEG